MWRCNGRRRQASPWIGRVAARLGVSRSGQGLRIGATATEDDDKEGVLPDIPEEEPPPAAAPPKSAGKRPSTTVGLAGAAPAPAAHVAAAHVAAAPAAAAPAAAAPAAALLAMTAVPSNPTSPREDVMRPCTSRGSMMATELSIMIGCTVEDVEGVFGKWDESPAWTNLVPLVVPRPRTQLSAETEGAWRDMYAAIYKPKE